VFSTPSPVQPDAAGLHPYGCSGLIIMSEKENNFFDNARIALEKEVTKIARKRGYVHPKVTITAEVTEKNCYIAKEHHLEFSYCTTRRTCIVVVTDKPYSCNIDWTLFPSKQKFPSMVKTLAEAVVSVLFES
jgi:hypothetical protein